MAVIRKSFLSFSNDRFGINVVHCKAIVKKTAVVNCAKAEEKYVKRVVL